MAIENNDLLVLQKNGGGELRKATVSALLASVVTSTPNLDEVTTEGGTTDNDISVGKVTTTEIDCAGEASITGDITGSSDLIIGQAITANDAITGGSLSSAGNIGGSGDLTMGGSIYTGGGDTQIELNGTTGEITGGASVFIDGGEYAT